MVEPVIARVVQDYLRAVRQAGIAARCTVLYGSHGRGDARPDSDIDVLVVAPEFDSPYDRRQVDLLWALRAATGRCSEPVAVGEQRWREDDAETEIRFRPRSWKSRGGRGGKSSLLQGRRARCRMERCSSLAAVTLIERGAPRDFRDIHAVCHAGLVTPEHCWALWRRRQQLAGSDTDQARARLAIETHLARIEQHRPLMHIDDAPARAQAEQVRTWFREAFLHVIDVD